MQISLAKWGNSTALRLPQQVLAQIKASVGDKFNVTVKDNKIILEAAKPDLTTLLEQVTDENKHQEQIINTEGKEYL